MAAILAFRSSHHAGRLLIAHSLRQPSRTYIALAPSALQQHQLAKKPGIFSEYGYPIQCRRFSLAYYLSPDYPPVGAAQSLFETVHTVTGLPWWAAILVTTWGLRTAITVPLAVYTAHMSARLQGIRPEMEETMKELKGEVVRAKKLHGWNDKQAFTQFKINRRRLMKKMYIRENCHPAKTTILAWVQIPMWISLSLALRNMAGALPMKGKDNIVSAPGLAEEGFWWVPNLLLADTTFIIPVSVALLNLTIIEMHALRPGTPTRFQKGLTWTLRGLSIVMVPIAASVPSCMAFYWASSSFFGLVQNIALQLPSVRRACRIPRIKGETDTPFKDLARFARQKFARKERPGKS